MSAVAFIQLALSVVFAALGAYAGLLGRSAAKRTPGPEGLEEAKPFWISAAVLLLVGASLFPAAEADPVETYRARHERGGK